MQQLAVNTSRDRLAEGWGAVGICQSEPDTRSLLALRISLATDPVSRATSTLLDRPCTRDLSRTAFETKNSRVRAQCQEQFNCASLRPKFSESSVRLQYYGLQLDITFCGCFLPRLAFSHTLISVELELTIHNNCGCWMTMTGRSKKIRTLKNCHKTVKNKIDTYFFQ